MTSRLRVGIGVALAMLLMCCVSVGAVAAGRVAAKPVLNMADRDCEGGLDPIPNFGGFIFNLTNEPLINFAPHGGFRPGLATSWRYLPSPKNSGKANKGFEVTLRRNARFSDGVAVTAQAVKDYLDYYEKVNGPNASELGPLSSVSTVGKWTVRIYLKTPNPVIPFALTFFPISSPRAVANPSVFATQGPFGAGPYMVDLSHTVINSHATLVPNPYYYDKSQIRWSKIVCLDITDATTAFQALQAGQVDLLSNEGLDSSTTAAAVRSGFKDIAAPAGGGQIGLALDVNGTISKPLSDIRVRRAIAYAIDKKSIVKAIYAKTGVPASEVLSSDGANPKYQNYYAYSPAKAKALLAAAGYPNGFTVNDVIVFSQFADIAGAIASNLAGVGIKLNLDVKSDFNDWLNSLESNTTSGLIVAGTLQSPMWAQYGNMLKPGSFFNTFGGRGWSDPVINQLWVQGSRASNPVPYWQKITARVATQALYIPIVNVIAGGALFNPKKVKGIVASPYSEFPLLWAPAS